MSEIGREISEATPRLSRLSIGIHLDETAARLDVRKWNETEMGPSLSQRQIRTSKRMDSGGPQNHDKQMESNGEFEMVQR